VKDIWDALENEGHGERLEEEMFAFLTAYADGETNARERRLVEAYLREEPDAERLLGFIRSTDAALAADSVEPPSSLREAILARTTRKPVLWKGWAGRLAVASGAAATVFAVVWSLRSDAPNSNTAAFTTPPITRGPEKTAFEQPTPAMEAPGETASHEESSMPAGSPEPASRPTSAQLRPSREQTPDHRSVDSEGGVRAGAGTMILTGNPAGNRVAPTPPLHEGPSLTVYSSEEPVTVRVEPKPIDPMAMEQSSQEDRRAVGGGGATKTREKLSILPDARERLRETLQKANEERDDLNDSSLNAPRRKSGNYRGVTQ